MDQHRDTRTPVLQYGQLSPPPSTKSTMHSPSPQGTPMYGFAPMSSTPTMTPRHAQMSLYYNGPPVESPMQIPQSPYQVPTPRHTKIEDDDREGYLEYLRMKQLGILPQQQSQQPQYPPQPQYYQMQQQQAYQTPPPNAFPPAPLPPHLARPQQRDSGYGSSDSYGAQFPNNPTPQQGYTHSTRPGHFYGKITARGKARVLMGDVEDNVRPSGQQRQHMYMGADADDEADVVAGGMTGAEARNYFHRPS